MSPLTAPVPGGSAPQHLVHLGGQSCFNSLSTPSQLARGLGAGAGVVWCGVSCRGVVMGRQRVLQ